MKIWGHNKRMSLFEPSYPWHIEEVQTTTGKLSVKCSLCKTTIAAAHCTDIVVQWYDLLDDDPFHNFSMFLSTNTSLLSQ